MAETKTEGLIYKGHPLRRIDNLIYYGTMADKYIVMMQVSGEQKGKRIWIWPPRFPSSSSSPIPM